MIRLGLSDTYGTRVLNSLKWLGLIDERGNPQESFEELKKASNDGYPDKLAEVVRKAYSRVFEAVEPSEVSDKQITDAFRSYEPVAQINLMVKLFMGLCEKAGIITADRAPKKRTRSTGLKEKKRTTAANARSSKQPSNDSEHPSRDQIILGLLNKLPSKGEWTENERDKWLQAFKYSLDIVVTITTSQKALLPAPPDSATTT